MAKTDDNELLTLYAAEAAEHLGTLNSTLLRLETLHGDQPSKQQATEHKKLIEALGRTAHSLKGASRTVGILSIERIAHHMESIFNAVKSNSLELSADIADSLYDALDAIQGILEGEDELDIEVILSSLQSVLNPEQITTAKRPDATTTNTAVAETKTATTEVVPAESIRVSIAKLDELMADASDLLIAQRSIDQRLDDVKTLRKVHTRWQKEWRKVRTQYIRAVRQAAQDGVSEEWRTLLDFLNLTQRYMRVSTQQLLALDRVLNSENLRLNLITDSIQDHVRRVRLVPFETYVGLFQRMVRDLAREVGKEIRLQVTGSNIELDKRVLEAIKDPIMHILRNAVDHGIESPDERLHKGKHAEGMIVLAISQRGSSVMIVIADDGCGIDTNAVREAAAHITSSGEVSMMSDSDVLSLVMLPGLSTSTQITSISGRGIGLDVVRQNIESLQGRIAIESIPDQGTTFRLTIPVSLSTIRCMLVKIGNETYAIPTTAIEQIISVDTLTEDARFSAGGRSMITLNERAVPIAHLAAVLERPVSGEAHYVLVLTSGDRRMAFLVSDLLTEQEIVVKNLSPELAHVPHVSGATLLGTGEVVIILNVSELIKTAQNIPHSSVTPEPTQQEKVSPIVQTVLVVDDSITTRALEKNILEAAGYDVVVATNGLEALDTLNKTSCAAVVADIEMPYMDGFELTIRIRHSDQFHRLPIVLVTSLDTPEHKERGLLAGADAYIVKGSFNQGDLLQTVRQLIG